MNLMNSWMTWNKEQISFAVITLHYLASVCVLHFNQSCLLYLFKYLWRGQQTLLLDDHFIFSKADICRNSTIWSFVVWCIHTVYCAFILCIVYSYCVLYIYTVYCVFILCTVHLYCVLCIHTVYCVFILCTEHLYCVLCIHIVYWAFILCTVYSYCGLCIYNVYCVVSEAQEPFQLADCVYIEIHYLPVYSDCEILI